MGNTVQKDQWTEMIYNSSDTWFGFNRYGLARVLRELNGLY